MEVGLVGAGVLVVVTIVLVQQKLKQARRAELDRVAASIGMTYATGDPFGTVDLPFSLFGMGDGRGVDETMHGTIDGAPCRLFDFWYRETSHDAQGHRHVQYERFTCCLLALPGSAPHLCISREGFLRKIANVLGFHDIEFESEEFNRTYNVQCDEPRFASAVVDARMMAWLLDHEVSFRIELWQDSLLVAFSKLDPAEWPLTLRAAQGLAAQVPAVAWELFPRTEASVW